MEHARRLVQNFAAAQGLEGALPALEGISALCFPNQQALCQYLADKHREPGPYPEGLLATTQGNEILVVSEAEARRLRPEFIQIDDGWQKLIAHEMTHLLHLALVDGDEEALGPEWFFEGLACFAAQQRFGIHFEDHTPQQVLVAVQGRDRQRYGRYEAAIRYFAQQHSLLDMIGHARQADFEDWLQRR